MDADEEGITARRGARNTNGGTGARRYRRWWRHHVADNHQAVASLRHEQEADCDEHYRFFLGSYEGSLLWTTPDASQPGMTLLAVR